MREHRTPRLSLFEIVIMLVVITAFALARTQWPQLEY
jgi:hypothetical protein